ncbi:acyl esterase [Dictyobacter vulcani]|uniref:Acyl esterase n=1 Tax=Dictyobacter vulcani TaxID=2607529 RepID=A0A5J4KYP6_9CHLR|nr:CocE/NonD family hydrolase [Dictyobacter vulcani]GER90276.1 acyl esterase [Dictyobacter vulcani]
MVSTEKGKAAKPSPLRVPPRAKLTGEQFAGNWRPRKVSQPVYSILFIPDISIPLPDGTILKGDLYRPDADEAFPVLLAWSGYTKELQNTGLPLPINEVGQVSYVVSRGYCHLTVNARGTGKSSGQHMMHFSPQEQKDVADTIEWAATQSWSNGNVGMIGMSYFAAIQYLAAAQQPPHLKAIFPYLGFTDLYRHFAYHGGAFHSGFFAPYYTFVGSTQKVSVPPVLRHLGSYLLNRNWIQKKITGFFFKNEEKMPQQMHPDGEWMRDFAQLAFDELYDGPFYREKSAWPVLDRIQVPVCIGTNWANPGIHARGAFQAWHGIDAPKKLFIGPPDPRWPWSNYHGELLAWYDYYLKGIDTGIDEQPAVRYWLQGADCWKSASDWPIPETTTQRFYLHTRAERSEDLHVLQRELPTQPTSLQFAAIPRGMNYPKELEKYTAQHVTYLSDPFVADTEITGPIKLQLTLSSTALDTHVIARLSDVSPEGSVRLLSFGWLQASHRKIDEQLSRLDEVIHEHQYPEPLKPGSPVSLCFSLTPTANLFKTNHRLRLEIGSRPDLLKATVFDNFIYFPYEAPPYLARNTIFHGEASASYLEIAVRDMQEHASL